jgi:hypothetical protein
MTVFTREQQATETFILFMETVMEMECSCRAYEAEYQT